MSKNRLKMVKPATQSKSHNFVALSHAERPKLTAPDRPLLKLKNASFLDVLGETLRATPETVYDGLANIESILFEHQTTRHYFHAYSDPNLGGTIVEVDATSNLELYHCFAELVAMFPLKKNEIEWLSEDINEGKARAREQYEKEYTLAAPLLEL